MRLHAASAVFVGLLALVASTLASIQISYKSSIFEIAYLSSDIFTDTSDPTLGPDRYVWQVSGLAGNVHFPPAWHACGSEIIPDFPCIRGATLLIPVSSSRLSASGGLTFILPSNRTLTNAPVSAVLFAPPSIYPVASGMGAVNFTGVDVSARADIIASYVPASEDPYTPHGSLLVQMTRPQGATPILDFINQIDLYLPENFWIVPWTSAPPLGTNATRTAYVSGYVGTPMRPFNRYWAVRQPMEYANVYGNGRVLSLRMFQSKQFHPSSMEDDNHALAFVIEGVYTSRDDSNSPAIRAFFSGPGTPTYSVAPAPVTFFPSSSGAIIGKGITVVSLNTTITNKNLLEVYRSRLGFGTLNPEDPYSRILLSSDLPTGDTLPGGGSAAVVIRVDRTWARAQFETGHFAEIAERSTVNYPSDSEMTVATVEPWMPAGLWMCRNLIASNEVPFVECPRNKTAYCAHEHEWAEVCVVGDEDAPEMLCTFAKRMRTYNCRRPY